MKFSMGRRKDFKSEQEFLEDVFNRNREAIVEAYGTNAKEEFFKGVRSRKVLKGLNVRQAINDLTKARAFTSYQDIARENLLEVLKKNDLYNQFRSLTRDKKGRYTSVNIQALKWDKDEQMYVYDNTKINGKTIGILIKNSPIRLTILSDQI